MMGVNFRILMLTEDTDDRFTDRNVFRMCYDVNVDIALAIFGLLRFIDRLFTELLVFIYYSKNQQH